jgi:hypothetical protein
MFGIGCKLIVVVVCLPWKSFCFHSLHVHESLKSLKIIVTKYDFSHFDKMCTPNLTVIS